MAVTRERTVADLTGFMEDVAGELRLRGVTVGLIEVSPTRPAKGRLVVTGRTTPAGRRQAVKLAVVWRDEIGWSAEWLGPAASRPDQPITDHSDLAAVTVACLVSDLIT